MRLLLGGSPCFASGTMILTDNGVVPIEDVKVGDMVWTHNDRWRKVTAIGNKQAMTYKLKNQGVYETIVTENHPYYTRKMKRKYERYKDEAGNIKAFNKRILGNSEWTEVKDLQKNDFCSSPIITTEENPYNLTKEECWILGRYVADGHIRNEKRKERIDSYYYQLILSIGSHKLDYLKQKIVNNHFSCYQHTQNVHRVVFSSKKLVEFVKNNDFGTRAEDKNIPGVILKLPIDLAKEFLDGYLSGDGSHGKQWNDESASTISRRLAFSLALLIQKAYSANTSVCYSKRKPKAIIEGRTVNQKNSYVVHFRYEMRKQSVAIIDDNKIWLPFKKLENNEITTVYNLSVEEDESYVANNLIVHNCTHWSIAQKKNRETEAEGLGWELFRNYLIAKEKFQPDLFLYENNKSASNAIKEQICKELGHPLQVIDSGLVSAQRRLRFYVKNWECPQPKNRNILLKDILELPESTVEKEKSYCLCTDHVGTTRDYFKKHQSQIVFEPVRIGNIKNDSQGYRVYSCYGKSISLTATGGGIAGKTGLYFTPLPEELHNLVCDKGKIYEVKDGMIDTKFGGFKVNLEDGFYIIRKLTITEACRLQTMPDDYTKAVSYQQGYKGLGNGWTAEVIIHQLEYGLDGVPKDYPIEVLSMYDGIGTGRYCLDKMGFTNVTYKAYEIDKYAMTVASDNYPDIVQCGDAFQLREENWKY